MGKVKSDFSERGFRHTQSLINFANELTKIIGKEAGCDWGEEFRSLGHNHRQRAIKPVPVKLGHMQIASHCGCNADPTLSLDAFSGRPNLSKLATSLIPVQNTAKPIYAVSSRSHLEELPGGANQRLFPRELDEPRHVSCAYALENVGVIAQSLLPAEVLPNHQDEIWIRQLSFLR
ncbi:MAG: hypothetical protein KA191_10920 [Verrucomicrobia bacterium]|nr:hypothetical protein [Verrucomicrobiota bacterium]MDI9381831.1 hypothetical protein [Verrucomicrobiota bacterium]NMD20004.1 hypothetical protein [Verrucomicrobiota bacterium]HOA60928.1 hypothetical protein [Verrucomicrobiota bacterium]HOF48558.1 hypothetical protein [Verrucomicrobiota bacterium]